MKRGPGSRGNQPMEFYRLALLARKAEVLSNLGVKFDTFAAMGRVAEEDQAQVSHDEYISLSLNSLDFQQLGLVEEALDRIKVGHYGFCQDCGEPIPVKRLKAIPWARYCIACQERVAVPAGQHADTPELVFDR